MDGEPNEGSVHAPFTLSSGGGDLYLYLQNGSNFVLVDSISYPVLDADVSFGRYPNGKGLWKMMLDSVTPAQLNLFGNIPDNLVINEFMANNDNAVAGPNNSYPDWIELFNGGSEAVDISGFYLSDDSANLKWQFPAGTVIDASSFLVVWCINSSANSGYANFNLSTEGEFICLVAEDGVTVIDSVPFSRQYDDTSYGRTTDGGSHWDFLTPTCGTTNSLGTVVVPGQSFYADRIPSGLVINEFMANNDKAVPGPDSSYPDWIELYNGGSETVDLGGYYLSDDPSNPDAWQFPSGTIINAGGFLVVWADNSVYERPLHTSFGLNATGESVCLFAPDAKTLVDSKTFGEQLDDVSYARTVDGGSAWGFLTPTPGQSNTLGEPVDANTHVVQVDVPESIYINEFMANNDNAVPGPNNSHPDWIEIYNGGSETVDLGGLYLSDDPANPDKWQFPSGTIIEPYGFLVIWTDGSSDAEELHASFALNASGEAVCLFAVDAKTLIDSVTFGEQLDDVSYGRVADGGTKWDYLTPTCGQSNSLGEVVVPGEITPVTVPYNLVINELMADNQITIAGPNEDYPDWIELYNGGNVSVDLGGMYLTDNLNNPTKWRFPAGTIIDAGGYLLVWADNSSESSSLHTRFGLNANGEEIGLFANDGTTLIDSVTFDKQLTDISYGRVPEGLRTGSFCKIQVQVGKHRKAQ
jgi:hypothetical protein